MRSKMEQQREFSRTIRVKEMKGLGGNAEWIGSEEATEHEKNLLAKRFNLSEISSMAVSYEIRESQVLGGGYDVLCSLNAQVTPTDCEISISEEFDLLVAPHGTNIDDIINGDIDIELLDENNSFDIGEIAAQYLSLFVYM
ncbi:MAG: hypothetical protein LBG13_02795 [Holosporales bacterium]|nr:hypothetical protein [Holosporales bacterium]